MQERSRMREKSKQQQTEYDRHIIETDKRDQALEQHKKDQLKQKVLEAKRMRDEMIKEANRRKIEAEKAAKVHEQELVSRL